MSLAPERHATAYQLTVRSPVLGLGDPRLAVVAEALDERILERAAEKALHRVRRAPDRAKNRCATIQAKLPLLEARIRTLVEEVARGYATDTLRTEFQGAEQRKRVRAFPAF